MLANQKIPLEIENQGLVAGVVASVGRLETGDDVVEVHCFP